MGEPVRLGPVQRVPRGHDVLRLRRDRKGRHELDYWLGRARAEDGHLENRHYEHFFTGWFGLDAGFYAGKRMLDVGCGPRGSLEWAGMAARRAGVDPLADAYRRRLGTGAHAMEYLAAPAEAIPAPDASFDVVSSFNSLDHVEDVGAAAAEMLRVLAPGGTLLLGVDVNHAPTPTEPHQLGWDVLEKFVPPLAVTDERRLEPRDGGLFAALLAAAPHAAPDGDRPGVLVARLDRPLT